MRRTALILLALILPRFGAAAQVAAPVITLPQSIDAALASGDENKILAGNLDVARAQHALNVSRNQLTLSASAGYGQLWLYGDPLLQTKLAGASGPTAGLTLSGPLTGVTVSASPYNVQAGSYPGAAGAPAAAVVGANVSQTLWNGYAGGPTQATVDKSLLALQGRELATDSGRLALIYSIKQAYYTMLAAQRNLALKTKLLGNQNAVLKQIQAVYDLKQASLADLKTAQVNERSAQVDVDSAAHDLRMSRIVLATLMGKPSDAAFVVEDAADPAVPVKTLDDAIAEGLKRRVEPKQLELSIKSGAVDLALARGQATPTVSVTGGVALDAQLGQATTNAYSVSAGVKVAMPVLDAGAARNQADAAARQNAVYALQEGQTQKSIASSVRGAWEGWQLAVEKLDLAKLQADASSLQLEILQTEFAHGTAANQDLLTAAVNDANAQSAVLTAASATQLAILQLLSVMGY